MYRGINILQFYPVSKDIVPWFSTDNKDNVVSFYIGTQPDFILYVEHATTPVITINLRDAETNNIVRTTVVNSTADASGFYRIKFINNTPVSYGTQRFLYYELTNVSGVSGNVLYSDVFAWNGNSYNFPNRLARFEIVSQNLTLAGIHNVPFSEYLLFNFMLNHNGYSISGEVTEDGVEKPHGNIPVFNTLNIKHLIEINGNKCILRFLLALRIFEVNGIVKINEDNGSVREIYGIEVNVKEENSFGDFIIIELSFREKDYISTRNEI